MGKLPKRVTEDLAKSGS